MNIIKRDGSQAVFDSGKIANAIRKANATVDDADKLTEARILRIASQIEKFAAAHDRALSVEEVQDNDSIYKYFRSISRIVKTGTVVALVVMGFFSVLLTVNTIRLTVLARRKELRIMRDLGASYAFMRGPFIAEGITIGLISALLAFFAVKGTYNYLAGVLHRSEENIRSIITLKPFSTYSGGLLTGFLLGGLAVGLIASMLAIRKYIDTERDDEK